MKRCPACETTKPYGAFSRNRSQYDGYQTYCRECFNRLYPGRRYKKPRTDAQKARQRERYRTDPQYREKIKAGNRQRLTGCSPALYDQLLAEQNDECGICRGRPAPGARRLHADHCHRSRTIRGLLCNRCNPGLGYFGDNPALLVAAAAYLVAGRAGWSHVAFTVYDRDGNPFPARAHYPNAIESHVIPRTEIRRMHTTTTRERTSS